MIKKTNLKNKEQNWIKKIKINKISRERIENK